MALTLHVLHVDTTDDEVVEVYKPKVNIEPSKKRAAKTAKAPTKDKVVEKEDSEEEPVIVKKAKGPARKAPAASKAPAKTEVVPAPSSGTCPTTKATIAHCLTIVIIVVEQRMKPAHKNSLQYQSRGLRLPRHARLWYLPRRPRQSQSRGLHLHPLSLVSSSSVPNCLRLTHSDYALLNFQKMKLPFTRILPLLRPRSDPNRLLEPKPALFHLWA